MGDGILKRQFVGSCKKGYYVARKEFKCKAEKCEGDQCVGFRMACQLTKEDWDRDVYWEQSPDGASCYGWKKL